MHIQTLIALAIVAVLTGCAHKPTTQYSWGSYQKQLYTMYSTPEKATPEIQMEAFEEEIQKSKAGNKAIPPGVYAHLAYQYSLAGNDQKAIEYLELEKQSYPESTTFINSLLKRIN